MINYIFVTGGVVSSLGKGITAASLGRLLKERGYKVTIQKFDPYLNVDPGTMSPYQHGEVFVTADGAETDLDLGHYERFINEELTKYNNVTSGKIMSTIINKERKGDYLGGTVQVIPHVTNEIKKKIMQAGKASNSDIVITEIGGTIGDIESNPFIEAIRQFKKDVGRENVTYIHVTLLPYLKAAGELKTKPTQQSVKMLQGLGVNPDIIILRSEHPVDKNIKSKVSLFCDVDESSVIEALDANNLYEIPIHMEELGLADEVCKKLNLENIKPNLEKWKKMVNKFMNPKHEIKVAVVGKYVELKDAYISINESIEHAGFHYDTKVKIDYLKAEEFDLTELKEYDGILVPGGFGGRGIEGKINTVRFARENKIPFFGICLGMQMATIEFARNVLGMKDANSTEFDENTSNPVISLIEEQGDVENLGGTMRLGAYPCKLDPNSKVYALYGQSEVLERHRHRYEFNQRYIEEFEKHGFKIVGKSPDGNYVEIIEIENHPFFVAAQFHPEFMSRPNKPHSLFKGWIKAILDKKNIK
ncbi:CTP synthase [Streptobacillus notomytis]|uniref:CTP synthase n=1 Tax=Streptobacillus notomytis TaxID=1712031 RepID=UPI000ADB90F6|nr:CTP synthase [Streptobacillus notomytis]